MTKYIVSEALATRLIASFSDRFHIEFDVPNLDAELMDRGVVDVVRLTPKDQSSVVEFLSMCHIDRTDQTLLLFHKLRSPYPQLLINTLLPTLPEPVYPAPIDLSRMEAAVRVLMALDWKNQLVEMLAGYALSGESNEDADRFLHRCFKEDQEARARLRLV